MGELVETPTKFLGILRSCLQLTVICARWYVVWFESWIYSHSAGILRPPAYVGSPQFLQVGYLNLFIAIHYWLKQARDFWGFHQIHPNYSCIISTVSIFFLHCFSIFWGVQGFLLTRSEPFSGLARARRCLRRRCDAARFPCCHHPRWCVWRLGSRPETMENG